MPPLLYTPARLLVLLLAAEMALLAPARARLPIIGGLLEPPARVPPPGPSAPPTPGSTPEAQFQQQLRSADLQTLNLACQEAAGFNFTKRMQLLRQRLLNVAPAPQPLAVVLVNANALLSCKAPEAALTVLNRYGPKAGPERDQWLIQRWRAAQAGLHHQLAAESLQLLARGVNANLEAIALPLRLRDDGTLLTRPALDALADHLVALGRDPEAAAVLLSGRIPGQVAAERLQRAAALLAGLPVAERDQLLESALDQAAAACAWGLAASLLNDQWELLEASGASSERSRQRLRKLSQRVDDAYSEWQATRQDPQQGVRAAQLQQQLRSPRAPGGHATTKP